MRRKQKAAKSLDLKRAAAYIRVSTGMQAEEGESLASQQVRLQRWAADNGYVIVAEYVDAGESARTTDRPEFIRMLQDAKEAHRPFDAILVWKWDRFMRNSEDAGYYKAIYRRRLKIELVSITQPTQDGALGDLMEKMLDIIAEFQSALTAENVHSTMLYMAEEHGSWLGMAPFGYRIGENGRLVIQPDESEAVTWAFLQVARRESSVYSVSEEFSTGTRFPSTLGQGRFVKKLGYTWSPTALRKLLQNRAYLGETNWNKRYTEIVRVDDQSRKVRGERDTDEWVRKSGAHESIIDEEIFEAVQRVLEEYSARYPKSKRGDYFLRGLLRCAKCGHQLTWYNPDNGSRPKYVCSQYFRPPSQACRPMVSITPTEISEALQRSFARVLTGGHLSTLDIAPPPKRKKKTSVASLISDNRQRLTKAADMLERGTYSEELFNHRRAALDEEYERLLQMLDEEKRDSTSDEATVAQLQKRLANIVDALADESVSVTDKNRALMDIIEHVVIDPAQVDIVIRWRAAE